jgi:DNA-binding transcriptional ArsR family regulator
MNGSHLALSNVPALCDRLAALSHPARLRIVRQLADACCCCKDVVERSDLAQSTVSQHLKILVAAGLVRMVPDGQRSLYRLETDAMVATARELADLVACCCPAGMAADTELMTLRTEPPAEI